jgi:WD40 repeat protein
VDWQPVSLSPVDNGRPFRLTMPSELRRSAKLSRTASTPYNDDDKQLNADREASVSSVKRMEVKGRAVPTELVATCADDRTVMLWDPSTWEVYHILRSKDVAGWYTITYHALERNGHRIICGTENGYALAWDLNKREQLLCGRLHNGSIEGLHWNHSTGMIATCSSDCNAMLLQFDQPKNATIISTTSITTTTTTVTTTAAITNTNNPLSSDTSIGVVNIISDMASLVIS